MKKFTKLLGIVLIIALVMSMGITAAFAASITISTDETYVAADGTAHVYNAYKIFDAKYETLSNANTQDDKDTFTTTPSGDPPVAYFMATGNPWIATVQGMTDYFTVTAAADGSGYNVVLKEGVDNNDTTAKAIAAALNSALTRETDPVNPTGDYAPKSITAGSAAQTVDAGYYLIKSATSSILALVTTDVTLVEKDDYTKLIKEFSDETKVGDFDAADDETTSKDDSVQVGDTVSFTLTVYIPAGANQPMVVTDTFTSGLTPVLTTGDSPVVATTITNNDTTPATVSATVSAPASGQFTVTFDAATVTANAGKTITIVYQAVVNEDAAFEVQENTGKVKYGNDYETQPDKVDTQTYNLEIDKKAESESGDDLGGAQFELYRTDTDHSLTKVAVSLVALTDTDLAKLGTTETPFTKAEKTIYYRVAEAGETGATTTIDMTEKDGDEFKYTKAVIYGLDGDSTYSIRETKAPVGYNKLDADVDVAMNDTTHVQPVVNNSGTVLPSTGGIGTTIFYVVGSILVVAAGVLLITKKRMSREG